MPPIYPFYEYGQAIGHVINTAFSGNKEPKLALVAGSQYDIKPTLSPKNLPMTAFSVDEEDSPHRVFDIVSSSCIEQDYLYTGYEGKIKK